MSNNIRIITKRFNRHFLPSEHNEWKALLLKNMSLLLYVLFIVILAFLFNFISAVKPGILGFASNITKEDIVSLTNQHRNRVGSKPLVENPLLTQAAIAKANDMFSKNYWAHYSPSGESPWDFIRTVGYQYTAAGENLARDFDRSESVVNAWLASPSHRDNLLNPLYSEIGVGVVNGILDGKETTLVVQMFATPAKPTLAKASENLTNEQFETTAPSSGSEESKGSLEKVTPSIPMLPTVVPTETVTPMETGPIVKNQPGSEVLSLVNPKRLINSYQIIRATSLALLIMLLLLLLADFVVMRRKHIIRVTGQTMAHFGLLLVLLVAIWYTSSGLIL